MSNITKERINKFIDDFKKEKLVQKYLCKYTWLSGSSTTVYPITIWKDYIEIQWSSDKNIFKKFIDRIEHLKNYPYPDYRFIGSIGFTNIAIATWKTILEDDCSTTASYQ